MASRRAGGVFLSARMLHLIDELVRQSPEQAYDADFFESFAAKAGWRLGR